MSITGNQTRSLELDSSYNHRMNKTWFAAAARSHLRWQRGFSGALILVILIGLAVMLWLYFGSTGGNKSYMQTVVQTKKEGESLGAGIQAQQLAILVADYRMNNHGKAPASFAQMGADESSFRDQWGKPVRFRVEPNAPNVLVVISDGPDGRPDTEDDVMVKANLPY